MSTERPRTCATCAHRSGTVAFGTCVRSGYFITTERKFPVASECGVNFNGWVQREPLWTRIKKWLYAA